MDNVTYTTLSRQSGLLKEMDIVANNIANASTTGYRREGTVFSEYIKRLGKGDDSLSMATPLVREIDRSQGTLTMTGSSFDLAIEGDGFFQVETPSGLMMTRAGSFAQNTNGELVDTNGRRLVDLGGAPIFVPPDARDFTVARDGTVSADGIPLGEVSVVEPTDWTSLSRDASGLFTSSGVQPAEGVTVRQGFIEESNVDPITEISRMIEVQRSYEQGAKFLDDEHERIRSVIQTLGR